MPFDPKLIQPDEPPLTASGDLDLPDDLKTLAEQLGEDAAHLAHCYPPRQDSRQPEVAARWRRQRAFAFGAAAAALASLLIGGVAFWRGTAGSGVRSTTSVVTAERTSPAEIGESHSVAAGALDEHPLSSSTLSLAELSGPEMEALLDLLEREPGQVTSIAF